MSERREGEDARIDDPVPADKDLDSAEPEEPSVQPDEGPVERPGEAGPDEPDMPPPGSTDPGEPES